VGNLAREPHLVAEALERRRVGGDALGKELQRDGLAQHEVGGLVDFTHAALAQAPRDAIPLRQHGAGREPALIGCTGCAHPCRSNVRHGDRSGL